MILRVTRWLIRRAARRAPPALAERLAEEWAADLAGRGTHLARLRFALGCCWATHVIAFEHRARRMKLANAAGNPEAVWGGLQEPGGRFGRPGILLLVVALHVVLFYALMTGLGFSVTQSLPALLQTRFLDERHPHDLPPLPPPTLGAPKLDVPRPEFPPTDDLADADPLAAQLPPAEPYVAPLAPPEPPPAPTVSRVQGGPAAGFPNPDDYYPSAARRLEEQGTVTVQVCVDPAGRLNAEPRMQHSSGSARLDAGAIALAKAGSGHYRASTEDGRPVSSCYAFRVRFQLRN